MNSCASSACPQSDSQVTTLVGTLNLVLGLVYLQYGTMTILDMRRNWGTLGFSHFGAAWIAMAFTCGPHHVVHGFHVLAEGRAGGPFDAYAVIVGFPAGVLWFLLRVEGARGGRGDRFISGTPGWVAALPYLAAVYVVSLVGWSLALNGYDLSRAWILIPNILLVGLYLAVGYYVLRTQLANRPQTGGWSVSGLSLGIIFPTCAAMHAVFALYALNGRYPFDTHTYTIDALAVPAAVYFLWVVRGLYRDTLADWHRAPRPQEATAH